MDKEISRRLWELCNNKAEEIRREHCPGWRGGSGGPMYTIDRYKEGMWISHTTLADGSERVDIIRASLLWKDASVKVETFFGNMDAFWGPRAEEYAKRNGDHRLTVIDGQYYGIGPTPYPNRGGGFGGRHFRIQFNDGVIVDTCDLWSGGVIPPFWREKIKDNAVFLDVEPGYMYEGIASPYKEGDR